MLNDPLMSGPVAKAKFSFSNPLPTPNSGKLVSYQEFYQEVKDAEEPVYMKMGPSSSHPENGTFWEMARVVETEVVEVATPVCGVKALEVKATKSVPPPKGPSFFTFRELSFYNAALFEESKS